MSKTAKFRKLSSRPRSINFKRLDGLHLKDWELTLNPDWRGKWKISIANRYDGFTFKHDGEDWWVNDDNDDPFWHNMVGILQYIINEKCND